MVDEKVSASHGWECERAGLWVFKADGVVVARVEQGKETRKWYWTAWVCEVASGGPPEENMADAQQVAEDWLAGA